jgi:hypothetical protein
MGLIPLSEKTIQGGNLPHEVVEVLIHLGHFTQRPDEQRARPRRPQKQRQMRQIPALDDGFRQVVHWDMSLAYLSKFLGKISEFLAAHRG